MSGKGGWQLQEFGVIFAMNFVCFSSGRSMTLSSIAGVLVICCFLGWFDKILSKVVKKFIEINSRLSGRYELGSSFRHLTLLHLRAILTHQNEKQFSASPAQSRTASWLETPNRSSTPKAHVPLPSTPPFQSACQRFSSSFPFPQTVLRSQHKKPMKLKSKQKRASS